MAPAQYTLADYPALAVHPPTVYSSLKVEPDTTLGGKVESLRKTTWKRDEALQPPDVAKDKQQAQ